MNNKHVTQYRLLKSGIDNKTLDSLKKGKNITLLTVEKICIILNCKPEEVFCFINENEQPSVKLIKKKQTHYS